MTRLALALFVAAGIAAAQGPPDCQIKFSFSSATPGTQGNGYMANSGTPCVAWRLTYYTSAGTLSTISIQVEGAATATGTYTALTASQATANPTTATPEGTNVTCCDYYPHIRVNPTVFTGTATISGTLYGYKGTSAANQFPTGAPPIGPAGGGLSGNYPDPSLVAPGTDTAVMFNSGGAFSGDAANFAYNPTALPTPAAPAVSTHGATGSTSYGYEVAYRSAVGDTAASAETTIANGNAALSATNYNIVTPPACPARALSVDGWRTTGTNTPAWLGNVACGASLLDTGTAPFDIAGTYFGLPPTTNRTVGLSISGNLAVAGHATFDNAVIDLDPGYYGAGANSIGLNYFETTSAPMPVGIESVIATTAATNATALAFEAETASAYAGSVLSINGTLGGVAHLGSGTVDAAVGTAAYFVNGGPGTITYGIALQATDFGNQGAGQITNAIGLNVKDVKSGSASNRAIQTGLGISEFGDALILDPLTFDPGCTVAHYGAFWFDNGGASTVRKTCNKVAGTPTWVVF